MDTNCHEGAATPPFDPWKVTPEVEARLGTDLVGAMIDKSELMGLVEPITGGVYLGDADEITHSYRFPENAEQDVISNRTQLARRGAWKLEGTLLYGGHEEGPGVSGVMHGGSGAYHPTHLMYAFRGGIYIVQGTRTLEAARAQLAHAGFMDDLDKSGENRPLVEIEAMAEQRLSS